MIFALWLLAALTPDCGSVYFEPADQPPRFDRIQHQYVYDHIRLVVKTPGLSETTDLDYPWTYPTQDADPFIKGHEKVPMRFQFPPPEKRASEPPLVQFVMTHTTDAGYTELKDCPPEEVPSPSPTASKTV